MQNARNIVNAIKALNTLTQAKLYDIVLQALIENPSKILSIIEKETGSDIQFTKITFPQSFGSPTIMELFLSNADLSRLSKVIDDCGREDKCAKIPLIKELRNMKGLGLAESKGAIERLEELGLLKF